MAATPKSPKDHFIVLYFASASSFTSKDYDTLPAPLPIGKLFDALEDKHSGIKEKILSSCLVTVNLNYVDVPNTDSEDVSESSVVIQEGDEVAIIPPVSSG
ncbi:molybdopterin synthase sulfur carrier subunit [Ustulina deusta]|nr:molybdopterin synthase sulfur carrier subunit [Ustulina deusta]